MVLMQNWCN